MIAMIFLLRMKGARPLSQSFREPNLPFYSKFR